MALISEKNIYYLGPDGSNAHCAMLKFLKVCNISVENKIPQRNIRTVIDCEVKDLQALCVLPIENSIEGIVRETIDNLLKVKDSDIQIRGEISLPIRHLLLAKTTNINDIKKIISHPQALAQCSSFLHEKFKNAEIQEVSSTSYAAQKVSTSNDNTIAAIANEESARIFNLNVLSSDINDENNNLTRFYILSRKNFDKTQNGKTALAFATKNESGALCKALQVFDKYSINLTYIDSRPSKKKIVEYEFFVEIEGYREDEKNKNAISELSSYTEFVKILGSFQVFK